MTTQMRRSLVWAVACAALVGFPAAAQSDLVARRAVAAEYLALSLETIDVDALARQLGAGIMASIADRQPEIVAQQGPRIEAIVVEALSRSVRESMQTLDADMAETFTLEELTALRDFYASDVGRSVMTRMPAFMAEVMPAVIERAGSLQGGLIEALAAEGVDL